MRDGWRATCGRRYAPGHERAIEHVVARLTGGHIPRA